MQGFLERGHLYSNHQNHLLLHFLVLSRFLAQVLVCLLYLFSQNVVGIGHEQLEVPARPIVVYSTMNNLKFLQIIVENSEITSSNLAISGSVEATGGGTGVETRAGVVFVGKGAVVGGVSFKVSCVVTTFDGVTGFGGREGCRGDTVTGVGRGTVGASGRTAVETIMTGVLAGGFETIAAARALASFCFLKAIRASSCFIFLTKSLTSPGL